MTPEETRIIRQHQKDCPVDITALATGLGLTVYDDFDMEPGISGKIMRDPESRSGFTISVNGNEPFKRRRFTVAHECAHFLRHRDKIGDGIFDDAMYRSDQMNTQDEFEANNIAADLLMPKHLVKDRLREGYSDVSQLAELFQVSEPAMRVRMRFLYQYDYV